MVHAWYMDELAGDQRLPHQPEPLQTVSVTQLAVLGVLHWRVPVTDEAQNFSSPQLELIRKQRGYTRHDFVELHPDKLPNYEQKLKTFFEEHLHVDEEIRFVLEGSGYFDVRDDSDRWIRIHVQKGDMIVLPAGIYHRFTLDSSNYARVMRLFLDEPVWTPYNRSSDADKMAARQRYLSSRPVQDSKQTDAVRTYSANGESFVVIGAAPPKANYPHMRLVNGMLYLSGVSSRRPDNSYRGVTQNPDGSYSLDMAEQTRGVIENLQTVLKAADADLSHLVDVTCFLTDMKNYAEFNKVYNQYFDGLAGPTRTTVAVQELPGPRILLEIKAVAIAPERTACKL